MARNITLDSILDDVHDYLRYQEEEGIDQMDVSPETLKRLARAPRARTPAAPERPTPPPPPTAHAAPAPAATPELPPKVEGDALEAIAGEVAGCTLCDLHKTRTKTVPGQGAPHPDILFIGEGPGAEEDKQGLAFVGRAGQLLTKMIQAMGYTREEVFIGNIVKCRPPDNRVPLPDEMATCLPYLKRQIAILRPKVIVALGSTAVKALLQTGTGITQLRGSWHTYEGIDFMPTFHPAYLLRNPSKKREAWEDLKEVLARLGKEPPPAK